MFDVIIVGAGLAGSSLAVALARQGWQVLLLERDHFPRHKVCGEFLSPEVRGTFERLGLWAGLLALEPAPLRHAALTTPGGSTLRTALPGAAWGLSRCRLDAALADAAAAQGAVLRTGCTVTGWQQQADHALAQVRQGREATQLAARSLVMACGRHTSPGLPPRASPAAGGSRWSRCVGVKVHLAHVLMPPQVELYFFPGGYVGINPVEEGRANVCMLISYRAFGRAGQSPERAIEAAAEWNPAFGRRLAGAQLIPGTQCSVAPVDTGRQPAPWDGVACLGDTAAMIPPLCGDGMAMAIRAAELCAPLADAFLRGQISQAAWAAAYTRAWQREFNSRLRWGRLLQRGLGQPLLRDGLIGLGRRLPALTRWLVQATRGSGQQSQTWITPGNQVT